MTALRLVLDLVQLAASGLLVVVLVMLWRSERRLKAARRELKENEALIRELTAAVTRATAKAISVRPVVDMTAFEVAMRNVRESIAKLPSFVPPKVTVSPPRREWLESGNHMERPMVRDLVRQRRVAIMLEHVGLDAHDIFRDGIHPHSYTEAVRTPDGRLRPDPRRRHQLLSRTVPRPPVPAQQWMAVMAAAKSANRRRR